MESTKSESALLLGDYACHKTNYFNRIMIPPQSTSCLQPCHVVYNQSIKDQLNTTVSNWMGERDLELRLADGIPTPKRDDAPE